MPSAPLILITPSTQTSGVEFSDASISLSHRYSLAIALAGGLPLILPCTDNAALVRELIARADGILLTGGDDVQTKLYAPRMAPALQAKVGTPEPERDLLELNVIDEVFRQRKPLLGICRGQQILNVALGGTLIADIPTEVPRAMNHRRMDKKCEPVHSVELTPGSDFARFVGRTTLNVNSTHHQSVGKVAAPLQVTARSVDGIIEAMELKDKKMLPFLLTVQFHPERLIDRQPEMMPIFTEFVRASTPAA